MNTSAVSQLNRLPLDWSLVLLHETFHWCLTQKLSTSDASNQTTKQWRTLRNIRTVSCRLQAVWWCTWPVEADLQTTCTATNRSS